MEKIIFLDIDLGLATPKYLEDGQWAVNPDEQKLLGEMLDKTDAKIVLSTSYDNATLEKTKDYMDSAGFLFNDKLIGVTIRADQWIERGTVIHLSIPIGVEIKQWIDTHIHSDKGKNLERKKLGKDFTYVILDDDSDMLLEHKDNFVQTKSEVGLTNDDVKRAVEILNKTCT